MTQQERGEENEGTPRQRFRLEYCPALVCAADMAPERMGRSGTAQFSKSMRIFSNRTVEKWVREPRRDTWSPTSAEYYIRMLHDECEDGGGQPSLPRENHPDLPRRSRSASRCSQPAGRRRTAWSMAVPRNWSATASARQADNIVVTSVEGLSERHPLSRISTARTVPLNFGL